MKKRILFHPAPDKNFYVKQNALRIYGVQKRRFADFIINCLEFQSVILPTYLVILCAHNGANSIRLAYKCFQLSAVQWCDLSDLRNLCTEHVPRNNNDMVYSILLPTDALQL